LYERVYRDLVENSTNSPEAIEKALKSIPFDQVQAEKRPFFFAGPDQLKAGAIGSLGMTQRPPNIAYDKYIEPVLTRELGFQLEWIGRFAYGDSELYRAWNDNGIEFHISLVPYGSFGSQTFVVIWAKDPREL
jgi:hypothetical protein